MRIEKTDMGDDRQIITVVEAESLEALAETEKAAYLQDDRLSPCYGYENVVEVIISGETMRIAWEPGDGGHYTLATYRVL